MEGLPVYVVVGASIVTIPLVVVSEVMGGTVASRVLVGVQYIAAGLVVTLRMEIGALFVVVGA